MVVMRLKDHKWCNAKHLHAQILWIEIQSVAVLIDHNPNPLPTPFSKVPQFFTEYKNHSLHRKTVHTQHST